MRSYGFPDPGRGRCGGTITTSEDPHEELRPQIGGRFGLCTGLAGVRRAAKISQCAAAAGLLLLENSLVPFS
jgi:hypothetical protein